MAYTKQTWADLPNKTTPINASRLGHIEQGIFDAAQTADNAASAAGSLATRVGQAEMAITTLNSNKAAKTDIAKVEDGSTASTEILEGEQFYHNSVLYIATTTISQGSAIVTSGEGQNCEIAQSVTGQIQSGVESAYQLVEDTVGWSGKNINKGDSGFVFVKSTARTKNFPFGKNIVKDKKYTVSFNVSNISGYTDNVALYVRFISDGVLTDDWGILTTATGLVEHTFTARRNINVGDYGASVYCFISSGEANVATVTVSNFMIREANIIDPTYEPYHATVDEQKCDNTVIAPVENGTTASHAYAVGEHFIRDGAFCTCKQAISQGATFTLNTNYVEGSVTSSIEDLYSNIGLKSTPVSAIVANNLPILKRDITSIFYGSSLRSEIAEGNFKNVRVGDYIVGQSTGSIYYVAECDGWLGRGDTEMQTHHLRLMLFKAAGITQLWAGYRWSGDTGHYSANELNRCPWNAATDVDPTSATASGSNNTNITRTYSGASVSAYMGSFIRDRLDNRLLSDCFEADFGSANVLQYKNWLGNSYSDDIVSGAISTWTGGTSNVAWYARKLDLPSEVELYGSHICSSSFYDVGTQCEQLALFKQAKINDFFPRMDIWTKAVSSSSNASYCTNDGNVRGYSASRAFWACPLACVS